MYVCVRARVCVCVYGSFAPLPLSLSVSLSLSAICVALSVLLTGFQHNHPVFCILSVDVAKTHNFQHVCVVCDVVCVVYAVCVGVLVQWVVTASNLSVKA